MPAGPTVGIGTGWTVLPKGRGTEFFLSKTEKSVCSRGKVPAEMAHLEPNSLREHTEVLRGEVGGINTLRPGRRADRWGWIKRTISHIIRTEGVWVSPTWSCYPRLHTSFSFGTPIDFFLKHVTLYLL